MMKTMHSYRSLISYYLSLMLKIRVLCFLLLYAFANEASSQQNLKATYTADQATSIIKVDGQIDPTWDSCQWSQSWRDIVTGEDGLYRTRFKSTWDKQHLYFLVEAIDPDIRASIDTHHAPLFKYDHTIELFLDPHGDQKNYYELQINAQGSRWELTLDKPYAKGGNPSSPDELENMRYAIGLNGTINDSSDIDHSWVVEIAIPWSSMDKLDVDPNLPRADMRINLSRVFQDDEDVKTPPQYWLWQPMGEFDIHKPEDWGFLQFR